MTNWNHDMAQAPKDRPILGWCNHDADPYHLGDGFLTVYGAHVEGLSHCDDGPQVLEWGGGWDDGDQGSVSDWWFVRGSESEIAANPIAWAEITELTL